MANLIRSAKSGNDWTTNDLQAYNIKLCSLECPLNLPSQVAIHRSGVEGEFRPRLDFAREILRTLGYEKRAGLLLRSRYAIPLLINGDPKQLAQTDVCLVQPGSSTILLVVA